MPCRRHACSCLYSGVSHHILLRHHVRHSIWRGQTVLYRRRPHRRLYDGHKVISSFAVPTDVDFLPVLDDYNLRGYNFNFPPALVAYHIHRPMHSRQMRSDSGNVARNPLTASSAVPGQPSPAISQHLGPV